VATTIINIIVTIAIVLFQNDGNGNIPKSDSKQTCDIECWELTKVQLDSEHGVNKQWKL
jgi:hypothetical protein